MPVRDRTRVASIAHRGASGYAPENTFASLDLAIELGAEWIELDVYLTADRRFVVVHDLVVCRPRGDAPWDSSRRIGAMTWAQLRDVDVGSWFNETHRDLAREEFEHLGPPLLEDVFERYAGRAGFVIDMKEPDDNYVLEVELIRILDKFGIANDDVTVACLSERCLRRIRSIEPCLDLAQVLPLGSAASHSRAELERICCYATALVAPKETTDDALVIAAGRTGMRVMSYTVNDSLEMAAFADLGVAGIITDFPDRLDEVLCARRGELTAS